MTLAGEKAEARKAAFSRRKAAHSPDRSAAGVAHLIDWLDPHKGRTIAGYLPIRTEIDPVPAMAALSAWSPVCVPVIEAAGKPLRFRQWTPGCAVVDGPFGAKVPETGAWLSPEVLIMPLVAFDLQGNRLGYGGGYYDRTLETLRAVRPTLAAGYAYAAQEADSLPLEPTDQPLDAIVTDNGIKSF